ncbi:hypothetical protein BKA00_005820 [Actinomadura coerulea]|uniref:Uncharacterized protein n=1 Tax=Actinomadura coerulea TaxID=46159 RepID=A0A7X0G5X8_9ACTN|nr:hypothetical protein [Actinomadura coerulea]MBB6398906.1 hypothetical protein [Actinomadura coerulea]GGP98354.1 hypothetical protein GCM10010187_12460 [Actinomadura coerulea]
MTGPDDLRAALGRLTSAERQTLAVRWGENARKWAGTSPHLGRVWELLAAQVADVDRMERARRAAGGDAPHTMRQAKTPRK